VGYHPEIILAGRRLNDSMGRHVVTEVVKHMMRKDLKVIDAKVLLLGFTFKENCPDIRNTRVIDIYSELKSFDMDVDIYDPWASGAEVHHEYGIGILDAQPNLSDYSAIILAVAHKEFLALDLKKSDSQVVYDVKAILPKENVDARL
jgi:UDP-N-acetyl-D-glucosamine/UDP-N-acetyl-D-galactosamine dehydrogenase